jgi:hypothetical protein
MKNQRGVTSRRLSADCNCLGEPAETPVLTTYSALGTDAALITDSDGRVNFGVNCAGQRALGATILLSVGRYD